MTGQERCLRRTIHLLKKNLFEPNNAVVFLACESDNPVRTTEYFQGTHYGGSEIRPTFRTAEFQAFMNLLEVGGRPAVQPEVFGRTAEGWSMGYLRSSGTVLQYYQVWRAWLLLLEYEKANNMKFDVVVRCRPDSLLGERLDFSKLTTEADERTCRSMGVERIRNNCEMTGQPWGDKVVWTLGQEQFWVARRDTFALLGPMVFTFGCWDAGTPYAFNSECFFAQFCLQNHIAQWAYGDGNMFNYSHPGDDEVTSDPAMFSLLR
jgi:hypothetical protein